MEVSSNVYPLPGFYRYTPWLNRYRGLTIGYLILLRPEIYKDLENEKPDPRNLAILVHEQTHVNRTQELGLVKFGLGYLFSKKFRFREELLAYKAGFEILKKNDVSVDINSLAKVLSSWVYFWPVKYDFAREKLLEAWEIS